MSDNRSMMINPIDSKECGDDEYVFSALDNPVLVFFSDIQARMEKEHEDDDIVERGRHINYGGYGLWSDDDNDDDDDDEDNRLERVRHIDYGGYDNFGSDYDGDDYGDMPGLEIVEE